MSKAYREYLELFEYFGRGGMVRLEREEFELLAAELEALIALRPNFEPEQLERLLTLQQLLFRERPLLRELLNR